MIIMNRRNRNEIIFLSFCCEMTFFLKPESEMFTSGLFALVTDVDECECFAVY